VPASGDTVQLNHAQSGRAPWREEAWLLFMADSVVPAALEVALVATRDWELR
jgi:hypothetical protein